MPSSTANPQWEPKAPPHSGQGKIFQGFEIIWYLHRRGWGELCEVKCPRGHKLTLPIERRMDCPLCREDAEGGVITPAEFNKLYYDHHHHPTYRQMDPTSETLISMMDKYATE